MLIKNLPIKSDLMSMDKQRVTVHPRSVLVRHDGRSLKRGVHESVPMLGGTRRFSPFLKGGAKHKIIPNPCKQFLIIDIAFTDLIIIC